MLKFNQKSFAKINLALEILFKRQDNYHELNTIFAPISLFDELIISENNLGLKYIITPKTNYPIEKNLVSRAANLFFEKFKIENPKITIELKKIIPIGAGLGGGSANAATVLLMLNDYYKINASIEELQSIGNLLGSDIAFFFKKQLAIGKGRGEELDYFNLTLPYKVLIVNPGIHLSTTLAYSKLNIIEKKGSNLKESLVSNHNDINEWKNLFINDFEKSVFIQFPEIAYIKKKMYEKGAIFSLMTGSGSTLFGIFDNDKLFFEAAKYFDEYYENSKVFKCKFIGDN